MTQRPDQVSLGHYLSTFDCPIGQEDAWALCYQTIKQVTSPSTRVTELRPIHGVEDVFINDDGSIHLRFYPKDKAVNQSQFLSSLGVVLFKALDHGLAPDEERSLHPSLENLIEQLTLAEDHSADCDDEGIERDSCEVEDVNTLTLLQNDESHLQSATCNTSTSSNSTRTSTSCSTSSSAPPSQSPNGHNVTFSTIIKLCTSHLPNPNQADIHYSAICSSLYAETQELDAFLTQVSRGTNQLNPHSSSSSDTFDSSSTKLDDIKFRDWARLWIQVIRDLKDGVKLKKVNSCRTKKKSDFDLTPYEKLLEDIRSQNYNLTHIDPNSLEKIKKDAHALILESIRSKPALVPVSKRILPPQPVTVATIHEKLMEDIRQPHTLKSIQPRVSPGSNCLGKVCDSNVSCSLARRKSLITGCNSNESTPSPRRRLIKADIDLTLSCTIDGQNFNALQSPHLKDEEMTDDVLYNNASNKSRNLKMKYHQPLEGDVDEDDEVENDTRSNGGRSQSNYLIGLNMANNNSTGNNNNTAGGNKNSNSNNNNNSNRSLDRKNSSFLLKALSRIWNLDLRY